jgi:hypothetical protein
MSDLFSSLLIFTIFKTILSTFFFTVSNFYKNLVKWVLTEIESSVAGTTTLDREGIETGNYQSTVKHRTYNSVRSGNKTFPLGGVFLLFFFITEKNRISKQFVLRKMKRYQVVIQSENNKAM